MRFHRLFVAFFACALAFFVALPASNSPADTPGVNWQVSAGSGTADSAVTGMSFYPEVITIDAGDSITWNFKGDAHTVTFLSGAPQPGSLSPQAGMPAGGTSYDGTGFVNSGVVPPHGSFTLTFTKSGTFPYVCLLHPGMIGTVVVQPAGMAYPKSQADYDEAATVAAQTDLGQGVTALFHTTPPASTKNADGSSNYNVFTGTSAGRGGVMRFLPGQLTIAVGDTVTWTNPDMMDPHTVTFSPDGKYPDFPSGPAFAPAGGPTYDGTTFTNSGLIFPVGTPAIHGIPTSTSYTLKFTKAGVYTYHCLLHDANGMIGKIRVMASASASPGPPIASVSVNTHLGPILTDSSGNTLYFNTSEIAGQPLQCTGMCLNNWTPLSPAAGVTDAVEGPGVTGTFEIVSRSDGIKQVNYGEAPLYTFAGDKSPGDIHGQGIKALGGVWLAAQVTSTPLIAPIVTANHGNTGSSASFVVSFTSTTPGQGWIEFGSGGSCSGLVEVATQDLGGGTTSHTIQVTGNDLPGSVGDNGIQPGATYSFMLVTSSSSGTETDNNGGKCYSVTIPAS
ncbi:MAG: plastocyanin/azurin family copper-binding protein [Chloroflexota bacterium]